MHWQTMMKLLQNYSFELRTYKKLQKELEDLLNFQAEAIKGT